ncbi:MAG: signal peptidase II [Polyangiaceae bacterium]|nr:signal peptidase II [Polyangiaceae bacterium]
MTDEAPPRDDAPTPGADAAAAGKDGGHAALPGAGEGAGAAKPLPHPGYAFLAVVAFITLAADLGTKWWAKSRLEAPKSFMDRRLEVVKDHVNLIFAKNMGGAWGILQDESEAVRRPFFLLISIAAVIFIVSLYRKLDPRQWALKWGLPLVLGGALGNLVDRIRYGYVVDFIQIRVTQTFVWPTFNVADVAIVVGVGLMAVDMFTSRRLAEGAAEGSKATAGGS